MSGREVESALHLGFVFQQIPETSTVPATSGETSRKRTADVEPTADVPSASRRRRNANTDASSYIRPAFPSCCVNGVVEQTCLMPSSTGYDVAVPAVQPPIAPSFGPQVIAPQVHAQLTALPSTSLVHNVTPIALHLHGPPSVTNYAYFLPHPSLMGLRLPSTPVQYLSQDIPFLDHSFISPSMSFREYSRLRRSLDELPVSASGVPSTMSGGNSNWDHSLAHYRLFPGFPYTSGSINGQMEAAASRTQVGQGTTETGADSATATHILASVGRTRNPTAMEYFGESTRNPIPLVEGPVAVPTMTADWMPQQPTLQTAIETVSATGYNQELERLATGEIPFRAWEAAVLQIFDRMGPQINPGRMPPKGMTKNEIDKLKSFRIVDPILLKEKVCVICQCDFEKRDVVRMLPCAHHFHLKCIDKWLKGNRTCPICRQNAAPDEDETVERVSARGTGTSAELSETGAENTSADEDGDLGNSSAEVQVITQMGATPEPSDLSFHDSH
ncbi:unnamed protein product [Litomosoides sigmodontis]|uniref:RING-type domain-containing protein n=1 Tax=Litomosoides sigmodontis TaxID=42156 RepID=A0A3P6V885_LITSI|nr:unnamed protein product [Litomosoides sigmodontis]